MIDNTIRFNDHNSFKVTSILLGYPFGVEQMDYITHSFQAYSTTLLASSTRARTKFLDADGATISDVSHDFAVTTVFGKVEITVDVPATAKQAQLVFLQGGTDWWFAEPKSEQGEISTPYNVNYAGQLTYITPNGIYTGMMTAGQIVVAGTTASPDETLDTKLVTISNGMINLSSTVSAKTTKITNEGVYTGEVEASQITAGYISVDRLSAKSITGAKLADGTVTATQIANATITSAQIANATITGAKIANATIDNAKISNLHGSKITANSITADKINVTNLYVDTVRGLTDSGKYAKFFPEGADQSSLTFYSAAVGGSPQPRGRIKLYGATSFGIEGIPMSGAAPNVQGTAIASVTHGNASVLLWNGASAQLALGALRLGIDTAGFYKSVDNGNTKTYF